MSIPSQFFLVACETFSRNHLLRSSTSTTLSIPQFRDRTSTPQSHTRLGNSFFPGSPIRAYHIRTVSTICGEHKNCSHTDSIRLFFCQVFQNQSFTTMFLPIFHLSVFVTLTQSIVKNFSPEELLGHKHTRATVEATKAKIIQRALPYHPCKTRTSLAVRPRASTASAITTKHSGLSCAFLTTCWFQT